MAASFYSASDGAIFGLFRAQPTLHLSNPLENVPASTIERNKLVEGVWGRVRRRGGGHSRSRWPLI